MKLQFRLTKFHKAVVIQLLDISGQNFSDVGAVRFANRLTLNEHDVVFPTPSSDWQSRDTIDVISFYNQEEADNYYFSFLYKWLPAWAEYQGDTILDNTRIENSPCDAIITYED